MERIAVLGKLSAEEAEREERTKRRIFEKVAKRMKEGPVDSLCVELNPDVIVIEAEQSFLFEPQNDRAAEWLSRQLGLNKLRQRERIRVHPARREAVAGELKAAGFQVAN